MTTKTTSGAYASGYEINLTGGGSGITTLSISASGYVEGSGVFTKGSASSYTIGNLGRIDVAAGRYAINLADGGAVTNGSGPATSTLIEGGSGVVIRGQTGLVTNFGSILAGAAFGKYGGNAVFMATGTVTNGGVFDTGEIISGDQDGVKIAGAGSVMNFGEILGVSYTAAGVGLVGAGTISNGSMSDTRALIEGGYGVRLFNGGSVTNGGASDEDATIEGDVGIAAGSNSGAIVNFGTVLGLSLDGISLPDDGMFINGSVSDKTALIQFYIGANLYGASGFNFGTVFGDGATGLGARTTRSALTNGAVNDSSATLEGHYGASLYQNSTLTKFGTVVGGVGVTAYQGVFDDKIIAEAGSVFDGAISIGGGALDGVSGVATTTGVVSYGAITGAGTLTLIIGSGGLVDGDSTLNLTIDTGANTIHNAGEIESVGAGDVTIASAVANAGKLFVNGGTFALDGAVAGAGTGLIAKGTLFAASTFTENVTFNGTAGILELAHAQTYTGTITGFSKTGTTSLDLGDITFASGTTKATYSGTTTSGTLTVTDGTHSARITLSGNYTASAFITSSDGHGGTTVVDTTPKKALHADIAAMAGFGEGVGAGPSGLGFGPEVSLSPPWPRRLDFNALEALADA